MPLFSLGHILHRCCFTLQRVVINGIVNTYEAIQVLSKYNRNFEQVFLFIRNRGIPTPKEDKFDIADNGF